MWAVLCQCGRYRLNVGATVAMLAASSQCGWCRVDVGGAVSNAVLYVALHQSVRDELRKLFRRRIDVVYVSDRNSLLPIIRY